jgi:hypothetical protein
MASHILSTGVAAAVSKEAGHGFKRTEFEPLAEDISGFARLTLATASIFSQHVVLSV